MQTAVGVFGNEDKQPNMTSSPPILALEVARDRNVCMVDTCRNVLYTKTNSYHMLSKFRKKYIEVNNIDIYVHAGSSSS